MRELERNSPPLSFECAPAAAGDLPRAGARRGHVPPGRRGSSRVRTLRTVAELRTALRESRRAGESIGLVPTMGALHAGHEALMHRARADCDRVVVSVFVNPAQFGERDDLAAYPRDEAGDAALAGAAGVDFLFAPPVTEVYPAGFATTVSVRGITEVLEGAARGAEHFSGVATVVLKLLNIAQPDVAYFGQKDAQQALVVRRLVRDLDVPVRIEVLPTVREPDGLALSSRNVHLAPGERARAVALHEALATAAGAVAAGERDAATLVAGARAVMARRDVEPEYLALVHPETLRPVDRVEGEVLAAVAARVGPTRLIDNQLVRANGKVG